jgi:hypothetical protein
MKRLLGRWLTCYAINDEKHSVRFWIKTPDYRSSLGVQACWRRPVYLLGGHVDVEQYGEGPIRLGLYLWPLSLYLNIETRWAQWVAARLTPGGWDGDRALALHLCCTDGGAMDLPGQLRWNLWTSDNTWSSSTPRWRHGSFHWADALLGRVDYTDETIDIVDVVVPMPEGSYAGNVRVFESTWRRRRFPFLSMRMRRTTIEIPEGIPHPGKGESAWDCGDDATYSVTSPASTPQDAAISLAKSVMEQRMRYGGTAWTPERKVG